MESAWRSAAVAAACATTLVLAAALLFVIQPMAAKTLLPEFGGAPAVWNAVALFFQSAVLIGYLGAHAVHRRCGRWGPLVMAAAAWAAVWWLPVGLDGTRSGESVASPQLRLILRLLAGLGGPVLVTAAVSPAVQSWFARTRLPAARDPYFLSVATSLGSLVALLAYPVAIEPNRTLSRQFLDWSVGYLVLIGLVSLCAVGAILLGRGHGAATAPETLTGTGLRYWAGWLICAAVPASLALGVTTHLTNDVAPIPMLWVVPLAIYLATYGLAYTRRPIVPRGTAAWALPVGVLVLTPALAAGLVQPFWLPIHLIVFGLAALACHEALAALRPNPSELTAYYLAAAIGGALGGAFNTLAAPLLFDRQVEYPLMLVAGLVIAGRGATRDLLRAPERRDLALPAAVFALAAPAAANPGGFGESVLGAVFASGAAGLFVLACWTCRSRPDRFALAFGAGLAACGLSPGVDGRVLLRERNFFGSLRVTQDDRAGLRRLFHGTTLHGQQALDPARRREPLSYFGRRGPIGDILRTRPKSDRSPHIGIVGLGIGSLAGYAVTGERWKFIEIDPAMIRIAENVAFFTYLHDARLAGAVVAVDRGDARIRLRDEPDRAYDLLVLDAFSSDAVPVHLLTREAFAEYRRKLRPGGRIVVQLSNRYLDLAPLVGALAEDAGWVCRVRRDAPIPPDAKREGLLPSLWAVTAATEDDLGVARNPRWIRPAVPAGLRPWTDESADVLGRLAPFGVRGGVAEGRGEIAPKTEVTAP